MSSAQQAGKSAFKTFAVSGNILERSRENTGRRQKFT